ncbi:hypothetical protein OG216_08575 [Streptomycetaceae bacterium NBC_01309]
MPDTPPCIHLPDHDPPLDAATARLLLRMLATIAAECTGREPPGNSPATAAAPTDPGR